ncbi:MAG: bifunctional diguanylate cyclase/phosphodiesterase [Campylobacter sp.]
MTLLKQIMLAVIAFSLVIFVAVGILNFSTINNYITTQLGTNARHTANSLGLSIKLVLENPVADMGEMFDDEVVAGSKIPFTNVAIDENQTQTTHSAQGELSTIETMMNSVFDSGYYSLIRLVDIDGKILLENSNKKLEILDVPDWFVSNIKLEAPIVESEIMRGWGKFGTLQVQSSTGAAYHELYGILKDVFYTLGLMGLVALLVSYFGINAIFRPLKNVQKQAEAILENRFILQEKIPFTVDIKHIVFAMNSMIGKVKDIFEQGAKNLSKYEDLLYKDEQTGVFNRRYFTNKFSEYLSSEEYSSGSVMMLSFKELSNLKKKLGFQSWNKVVVEIAKIISKNSAEKLSARLNDDDFIVVAPSISAEKMTAIGNDIFSEIKQLFASFDISSEDCLASASVVAYTHKSTLKDIFVASDVTLVRARESGEFTVKTYEDSREIALGKSQYKELILNALQKNMFKFAGQKIASKIADLQHCELYIRLVDENGKWQMASYFMPMVNELEFAAKIDLYVLNKVANMLKDKTLPDGGISVNIGRDVLVLTQYFAELENLLKKIKQNATNRVYIEIPNKDDIDISILSKFHQKIRELGLGLGLDHFGLDAKSIEKLKEISPDYVKIQARNLIDFFGEHLDQKGSFDVMMRSKNIKIIAIGVENEEQKNKLEAMEIDSMQGNFIYDTENIG